MSEDIPSPSSESAAPDSVEAPVEPRRRSQKILGALGAVVRSVVFEKRLPPGTPWGEVPVKETPSPESEEDVSEEWPRKALLSTEEGDRLVTATGLLGSHKTPEGAEHRYVYVEELKKAIPEEDLVYGTFHARERAGTEGEEPPTEESEETPDEEEPAAEPADEVLDLPAEVLKEAEDKGINPQAVKAAFEMGIKDPITVLAGVLRSSVLTEARDWGVILGVPVALPGQDKFSRILETGREHTAIGQARGELVDHLGRRAVERPVPTYFSLKRIGGPIPGVRWVAQRAKAGQIYRREKREDIQAREEKLEKGEDPGVMKDYSLLGGIKKVGEIQGSIRAMDEPIAVDKSELWKHRRGHLRDFPLERTETGDRILSHHESRHALKHNRLNRDELTLEELEKVWSKLRPRERRKLLNRLSPLFKRR